MQQLATLPAASVQCCVTSPPYWGLRDYGTASWLGGDAGCDHVAGTARQDGAPHGVDGFAGNKTGNGAMGITYFRDICGKCCARRVDRQLGLEATPDEYVANMVAVFREVRRVLRDDGTLWLNLGDSYASGGRSTRDPGQSTLHPAQAKGMRRPADGEGIKPKDLVGIPWRVAFALQADGWYLRQDIIWHKPNPMPESVTDRCTKAHEYIFLLTKSARYFYDHEAIKEEASGPGKPCGTKNDASRNDSATTGTVRGNGETRNKRSVWTVATKPFKGAHFATFPPDLIEPCILAGSAADTLVLDPFSGAGTTGVVAVQHGRRYIGIELNPDYLEMSRKRMQLVRDSLTVPMFADA